MYSSFFGLHIIDRFFSYYVDKVHEETQHMLVMQVAMHYKMYGSWNGYDGSETGAAAKLSGDYFTITDLAGNTVYTSEKGVERCCANPNHKYTRVRLPITVDGKTVGELTAGYFSNHISSPEADAFRGGGIWLVVLSIICISVVGAAISMLFFLPALQANPANCRGGQGYFDRALANPYSHQGQCGRNARDRGFHQRPWRIAA